MWKLPDKTYIVRFTHSDRYEIEEYEYTTQEEAREHFSLFGPEDAVSYSRIDMYERDWVQHTDTALDAMVLIPA